MQVHPRRFRSLAAAALVWLLIAITPTPSGMASQGHVGPQGVTTAQEQISTPTPPSPADKIEPGLRSRILSEPDQQATFLVYLAAQDDLSQAYRIDDWGVRGAYVYETLLRSAETSQADLLIWLNMRKAAGIVADYRSYYIVNAVAVTAGVSTLEALAARPDVAFIESMSVFTIPEPIDDEPIGTAAVEWGVAKIGADQIWSDFDVRGEGTVVANIDTGVLYTHNALQSSYRGTASGSHDYNWFDPQGSNSPFDNNGHGTHVMGTMVGDDGGSNQIGIAPQATWIAAKGCTSSSCSSSDLLASAEWILAPYPIGGSPDEGDPSKRPHVVNNSWGGPGGNTWYLEAVEAWRAADIFPAFAAGNSGPGAGSIGSPGDYAESFASGATDISDTIAAFSSRGPSSLTNETKPDVSAPGVSIRSAWNDGGYNTISGTSMASPHAAGCVALIRAAAIGLDLTEIENLLTNTALDLGSSGPDTSYGYGRIDCYSAVAAARAVPTPTPISASPTVTASNTPVTLTATNTPSPTATDTPLATSTPTLGPATDTPTVQPPTNTPAPGLIFFDDFEDDRGWIVDPFGSDTATTGMWERADPQDTNLNGPMQLGTTVSGFKDLVTGPLSGSGVGSHDIDSGVTSIRSPNIALPSSGDIQLNFHYYLAHLANSGPDDFLRVSVVGAEGSLLAFEELGSANVDTATWVQFAASLNDLNGQTIYLLIEAADAGDPSLVEAAVDDVSITVEESTPPTATHTPLPTATPMPPTATNTPVPTPTPTPIPPTATDTPLPPTASSTPVPPTATDTPLPIPTDTPEPGLIFFDDFEADRGWTRNPNGSDTATTGMWERADPQDTNYNGPMQLGTTVSGSNDLVTGPLAGISVGSHDIDSGVTSIRSPNITLPSSGEIRLTFFYYLAHLNNATGDDILRVRVIGETSSATVFEKSGSPNDDFAAWSEFNTSLNGFAGQTIYLLVEAADAAGPSLVEAAIDDLSISIVGEPSPTPTPFIGVIFSDDFESDRGWTRNPGGSDTATTGLWERADPQDTNYNGPMQLGTTVSGIRDLVSGALAGSSVGSHDIDNGATSIRSPSIALPSTGEILLSFSYYLAHLDNATADDFLRVRVIGQFSSATLFEELGSADLDTATWAEFTASLNSFAGQTVYLLIEAADAGSPSLVEAAVDDVVVSASEAP